MNAGDPVWYRQVSRGGYGYESNVPGEFVRATEKRVIVKVWLRSGGTTEIAVNPANVRPRDLETSIRRTP